MASVKVDPTDWPLLPSLWVVPPETLDHAQYKSVQPLVGIDPTAFNKRGNHLAYAATLGIMLPAGLEAGRLGASTSEGALHTFNHKPNIDPFSEKNIKHSVLIIWQHEKWQDVGETSHVIFSSPAKL